jgi:hypothetical protein
VGDGAFFLFPVVVSVPDELIDESLSRFAFLLREAFAFSDRSLIAFPVWVE